MICHPIYNDCRAHLVSTYALEVQDQTIRGRSLGWSMQGIPDPTKGPSLVDLDVLILQLLVVGQKIHEFPRNWCVLWESTGTPPKSPRFQGPKAHFFGTMVALFSSLISGRILPGGGLGVPLDSHWHQEDLFEAAVSHSFRKKNLRMASALQLPQRLLLRCLAFRGIDRSRGLFGGSGFWVEKCKLSFKNRHCS